MTHQNDDKRKVSTDALETLGSIIGENEKRDAIHLAVEPVVAKQRLYPAQDVGADGTTNDPVGIVDPFLKNPVHKGERFWLVIYPRQINSLRHVWTHPAFPDELKSFCEESGTKLALIDNHKERESKKWIEDFVNNLPRCGSGEPVTYDEIMKAAHAYQDSIQKNGFGEYLNKERLLEGESVPDEFWTHFEIITGKIVKEEDRNNFFSCSC